MQITITEKAQEMLERNEVGKDKFLRVTITQGGCAGLTYGAEFGQELQENESVIFQQDDIRLVSDNDSSKHLNGLVIDFSEDLISGGLRFTNPNSGSTCGCGSSFSLSAFPIKDDGNCCGVS